MSLSTGLLDGWWRLLRLLALRRWRPVLCGVLVVAVASVAAPEAGSVAGAAPLVEPPGRHHARHRDGDPPGRAPASVSPGAAGPAPRVDVPVNVPAALPDDAPDAAPALAPDHPTVPSPGPSPESRWAFPGSPMAVGAGGIPLLAVRAYQAASASLAVSDPSCGLNWSVLAGIGRVESDHGRYGGASLSPDGVAAPAIIGIALDGRPGVARIADTDGGRLDRDVVFDRAVGPMQFIPRTWAGVGVDGSGDGVADPHNIDDAALSAARYLCAGPSQLADEAGARAALMRYNRSVTYGLRVLGLAAAYRAGIEGAPGAVPASQGATTAQAPPAPVVPSPSTTVSGPEDTVGDGATPTVPPAGAGQPPASPPDVVEPPASPPDVVEPPASPPDVVEPPAPPAPPTDPGTLPGDPVVPPADSVVPPVDPTVLRADPAVPPADPTDPPEAPVSPAAPVTVAVTGLSVTVDAAA